MSRFDPLFPSPFYLTAVLLLIGATDHNAVDEFTFPSIFGSSSPSRININKLIL